MSPAPKETIVKVAEWAAERGDAVIVTLGLGSCVAIMLHDAAAGAGGMAHILLPSRSLAHDATNPAKFPDTAVQIGRASCRERGSVSAVRGPVKRRTLQL